ncbi:hypothetical protein [Nonomuraea endophytica]|uniref:Uncharacterized protein n=1 Tax=Nonomuraea endophytica TaxID=714136 RepID=A0A7W8EN91_9ACTN|nr:hypothetical protein [Nonomuraea endophytica]MBB5084837.1 hypothetical protein [Nonomuraea endophytica]
MTNRATVIGYDPADLSRRWTQAPADSETELARIAKTTGADFATAAGRVWETDQFVYLPVVLNLRDGETIRREAVVTLQPTAHFTPFDKALARIRRTPQLALSPHGVMYALNEASERVIDHASDALEAMNDEIAMATNGYNHRGREIGVSDIQDTIARMNEAEEIVSARRRRS